MNEIYLKNVDKVWEGIRCENKKPMTAYMGEALSPVQMGMTIGEYISDPVKGAQATIGYARRLREECGGLDCFNEIVIGYNIVLALSTFWLSRVLRPGIELPETSLWQTEEKRLVGPEVYDEIIKDGYYAFYEKMLPQVIDMDYYNKYTKIFEDNVDSVMESYFELGIPLLQTGPEPINTPMELICGPRSMSDFYMDCYKMLDKLVAVSDRIYADIEPNVIKGLEESKGDNTRIGQWLGGWRTGSALLAPKIWDKLVWPYFSKSAKLYMSYGKVPIFHLDSCWDRDIEKWAEFPEKSWILNPDSSTDVRAARKKICKKFAIVGDVPATLLSTGKPEEVSDYVKRLIDDLGPEGLFICPGCDAPANSKHENMVAMYKTANEWK